MHKKLKIAHLDIKLDNLLCGIDKNNEVFVKISDFTTSKELKNENELFNEHCGTPEVFYFFYNKITK